MKKFLSILITAAIACTLTACGNDIRGQVSEETVAVDEMKTIEPPEDGWTLEQLNQVLYMNGQKIELPLMFSSLGDGYEIRDIEHYDDSNRASGVLYYNNQFVAIIVFYEMEKDYKITNLSFTPSYYEDGQDCSNYIKINGFGLHTNTSNLPQYLGKNFTKESGFIKYVLADEQYTLIFTDVEEEYMIMLFEGTNKE